MQYQSTRDRSLKVTSTRAIVQGISKEGGLFVPTQIPMLSESAMRQLLTQDYRTKASLILSLFLEDLSPSEIQYSVEQAYNDKKFSTDRIFELHTLDNCNTVLELWHGPTCAFKDMALQILPYLLTISAKKTVSGKKIVILVATSGDTGIAALEGFCDVPDTEVVVFYPKDGVSPMQKRQMQTKEGNNISVCATLGNFDDAQTGVKKMFTNPEICEQLEKKDRMFSSANSMNVGRLLPQIVYYVAAYLDMVKRGDIEFLEPVNVAVPTGNFGNILAAYYAKRMGVPLGKLICASNENHILTDFIKTGVYDRNRDFHQTNSPSMDILISSNLERLLFELCGCKDQPIKDWYENLKKTGRFCVDDLTKQRLQEQFFAGYCTEVQTLQTIERTFQEQGYLCDTHTAVAMKVAEEYQQTTGDNTKMLIVSTASPYKFSHSVLSALGETAPTDEFEGLGILEQASNLKIPTALSSLLEKSVRFDESCEIANMPQVVLDFINRQSN